MAAVELELEMFRRVNTFISNANAKTAISGTYHHIDVQSTVPAISPKRSTGSIGASICVRWSAA